MFEDFNNNFHHWARCSQHLHPMPTPHTPHITTRSSILYSYITAQITCIALEQVNSAQQTSRQTYTARCMRMPAHYTAMQYQCHSPPHPCAELTVSGKFITQTNSLSPRWGNATAQLRTPRNLCTLFTRRPNERSVLRQSSKRFGKG